MSRWQTAVEQQQALWRYARTEQGHRQMQQTVVYDNLGPATRDMIEGLFHSEPDKLFTADPIYVHQEFCDMVEHAAASFRPEPFSPADLIVPQGFVYFQRPLDLGPHRAWNDDGTLGESTESAYLRAFSWCPMFSTPARDGQPGIAGALTKKDQSDAGRDPADQTVFASELPDRLEEIGLGEEIANALRERRHVGVALTLYADDTYGNAPHPLFLHFTPWWFEMDFGGNDLDEQGLPTYAEQWWKIVQPAMRLMQQTIYERRIERPDRATRRRLLRSGFQGDRKVVVVRLRRPRHQTQAGEEREVPWTHRWIVAGHWRNQWFPSLQRHRQIWIHPFVKGPEEKPLVLTSRRVFDWER